jgi:hypothetical protein
MVDDFLTATALEHGILLRSLNRVSASRDFPRPFSSNRSTSFSPSADNQHLGAKFCKHRSFFADFLDTNPKNPANAGLVKAWLPPSLSQDILSLILLI